MHWTGLESACYASEQEKFNSRNGNTVRPHCHNDVNKEKEMLTVSVCSSSNGHSSTLSPVRIGQSPVSTGISDYLTSTDGHTHTIFISLSEYQWIMYSTCVIHRYSEWVMYVD